MGALIVGPVSINGGLGGTAQVGILDPGYNGLFTVSVSGGGTLGIALGSISNAAGGVLMNAVGGTSLTLDLANGVSLGLLGPSGNLVTICEQTAPARCQSVNITNPGRLPVVGSSLDSIAESPGGSQIVALTASPLSGVDLSNFTVTAAPSGISVANLGNGQFQVSAAANAVAGTSGYVTLSDGTNIVNIATIVQ